MSDVSELYSLLIPLRAERMLVPRVCVAEVTAFAEPEPQASGAGPDWLLGTVTWNGRRIPVVSLDAGDHEALDSRKAARRRIVVFHALGSALRSGHYGVVTQGFPQLVRVNRDVVEYDTESAMPEDRPFLCRLRMIHEFPLVPDLDRLEQMLAERVETAA